MSGSERFHNAVRLIAFILIISFAAVLFATAKGNEGKGKFYLKSTCKECHTKSGPGPELTPLTKTQAQWKSVFAKNKHPRDKQPFTSVKGMDEEKINDISTFLIAHAADSPQPETCGK
jgi:hypothetical protein